MDTKEKSLDWLQQFNGGTLDKHYGAVPNVTVSAGTGFSTSATGIWTTTGTGGTPSVTITQPTWTTTTNPYTVMGAGSATGTQVNQGGKIQLQGKNADIDINGKSLTTWMEKVEERLNILTPNPEVEAEWDQLRKLGERYRKLEKKCREKTDMWNKLKAMPGPNVK